MAYRIAILVVLGALIAACESSTDAVPPTPAATTTLANPASPTPPATATAAPLRSPTPVPTGYITPPAPGQPAIIPILMYHHLAILPSGATTLDRTWTVAPKNFEAQMEWLAGHGYHAITMVQVVAHLKRGQNLPTKPVVITFDDGWEEGYTVAFPILKRLGLTGTFFVYTNAIGRSAFIKWPALEEMSAAGMDIQSHSLSHPHLRALDANAAAKELAESKGILEKRLGKPVVAFDYPFGEYNDQLVGILKRAGYESAVTIASGVKQRPEDLFALKRTRIEYSTTLEEFVKTMP